MRTILLIVLILLLIGAFPAWPYSSAWGYYPVGGIGLVLLIVLILAIAGRILPGCDCKLERDGAVRTVARFLRTSSPLE